MLRRIWSFLGADAKASEKSPGPVDGRPRGTKGQKAGEPRWNLNADEAERLLGENQQVTVLDVRTPEEYVAAHIRGARNVDFFDPQFQEKVALFDKGRPYLLHCASGHRSSRARSILARLSFRAVYHLDGGLKAWAKAGKGLVSGQG